MTTMGSLQAATKLQPGAGPLDNNIQLTSEIKAGDSLKSHNKKGSGLNARRNAKARSKQVNGRLLYLNSPIHKDYQRAYNCSECLKQEGTKFFTQTCMKRSCIVCSRIKEAKLFKQYVDVLMEMPELHMVTLTAPTVPGDKLKQEIEKRYEVFTQIKDALRKKGIKLKGLRKLEITYNIGDNLYHPHYHLIVSGKETSELILKMWLDRIPEADIKGQEVTPVHSDRALIELFKYITKDVVKNKFHSKTLDVMYLAIKGTRTVQPFGIKKRAVKRDDNVIILEHKGEQINLWKWCNDKKDWYSKEGEQLNEGDLSEKTKKALKIIDNDESQEKRQEATKGSDSAHIKQQTNGEHPGSSKEPPGEQIGIIPASIINAIRSPGSRAVFIE